MIASDDPGVGQRQRRRHEELVDDQRGADRDHQPVEQEVALTSGAASLEQPVQRDPERRVAGQGEQVGQ